MKKYVGLNQLPIDAQQLLKLIGEMIDGTAHMEDRVLVLEVKQVIDSGQIMLPLLEYREI